MTVSSMMTSLMDRARSRLGYDDIMSIRDLIVKLSQYPVVRTIDDVSTYYRNKCSVTRDGSIVKVVASEKNDGSNPRNAIGLYLYPGGTFKNSWIDQSPWTVSALLRGNMQIVEFGYRDVNVELDPDKWIRLTYAGSIYDHVCLFYGKADVVGDWFEIRDIEFTFKQDQKVGGVAIALLCALLPVRGCAA